MGVDSDTLEYEPATIDAGFPSSLGFGLGGRVMLQLSGFYCEAPGSWSLHSFLLLPLL